MGKKIFTIVDDSIEYKTKATNHHDNWTEYVMKTSKSDEWSESTRNKKVISALDRGNDLQICFKAYDDILDGVAQKYCLTFDYQQAFQLYCFLDLWHKTDPYFTQPTHIDKNINK